jgi:hypothetical protein
MWKVDEIMFPAGRGWSHMLSVDVAIHTSYFLSILEPGGPMKGVGMICSIR